MRWRSTPACAVALRTPTLGAELGAGQPWWLPGYLHDRTARCCSVLKMLDRLLEEGNEALAHERAAFELERKEMKTERSTLSGDCIVRSAAALQPEGVTIQWRENRLKLASQWSRLHPELEFRHRRRKSGSRAWKLKVSAGERVTHSFRLGHVVLCELPDTELLQLSADEHGKAVSADALNVGHTVRRDRIMNGTQASDFFGNGGLRGFDRRYVGLVQLFHLPRLCHKLLITSTFIFE